MMKYLERGGEVILEEPELDGCVGVPKDRQHHYSEIRFKKKTTLTIRSSDHINIRGLKIRLRCSSLSFVAANKELLLWTDYHYCISAFEKETHLRKRSYRWPDATENMFNTSSFFSASSFLEPPPVML